MITSNRNFSDSVHKEVESVLGFHSRSSHRWNLSDRCIQELSFLADTSETKSEAVGKLLHFKNKCMLVFSSFYKGNKIYFILPQVSKNIFLKKSILPIKIQLAFIFGVDTDKNILLHHSLNLYFWGIYHKCIIFQCANILPVGQYC